MTFSRSINTARWMLTFAKIVECGSISKAAQALAQDKAVTSRQLRDLEDSMGIRLLNRNTRHLSLTDVGAIIHERAVKIAQELEGVRADAEQFLSLPSGVLKISTSVAFGRLHVLPLLVDFTKNHPLISIELCLLDRHVNLIEEGYDLLLRLCNEPPANLSAKFICRLTYDLVATADLLSAAPPINCPDDLTHHNCLFYGFHNRKTTWDLIKNGEHHPVEVCNSFSVNNSEALRDLVLSGAGIALLPTFAVAKDLASKALQRVLPDYTVTGSTGDALYLIYMPGRYLPAKTRTFIDFLSEQWIPLPPWATNNANKTHLQQPR